MLLTTFVYKQQMSSPRPKAILIRPTLGQNLADVLGEIRSKGCPIDSGANVRVLRKTRLGDLLLDLSTSTESKAKFDYARCSTLGESYTVRCVEPKATMKLPDLE